MIVFPFLGDTELTDTTVIPKEPTEDTVHADSESSNEDSGHLENQVPAEPCENQSDQNKQTEVNQSTNQDGVKQTNKDEVVPDNQSVS